METEGLRPLTTAEIQRLLAEDRRRILYDRESRSALEMEVIVSVPERLRLLVLAKQWPVVVR